MKSNDTLLCHLVATDEMLHGNTPKLKVDELLQNPTSIEVAANEVVYIHFIHCKKAWFKIELTTPTSVIEITPQNTKENSSNSIIKALGNVKITSANDANFYVQLLRVLY